MVSRVFFSKFLMGGLNLFRGQMSGEGGQAPVGKWGQVPDGGIDKIFANWGGTPTVPPPRPPEKNPWWERWVKQHTAYKDCGRILFVFVSKCWADKNQNTPSSMVEKALHRMVIMEDLGFPIYICRNNSTHSTSVASSSSQHKQKEPSQFYQIFPISSPSFFFRAWEGTLCPLHRMLAMQLPTPGLSKLNPLWAALLSAGSFKRWAA